MKRHLHPATLFIVSASILFSLRGNADTLISCHDGDTCRFMRKERVVKVRFAGVDAPEIDQPDGPKARDFVVSQLKGKEVQLQCGGHSFDRTVCDIFAEGKDIQSGLVRQGWAFDAPKFSKMKYQADQAFARLNKLGIWARAEVVSPYCWRKNKHKKCKEDPLYQP